LNLHLLSFKVGTGPHYISIDVNRQSDGFVFSDYFLLSWRRDIVTRRKSLFFNLYSGVRHLSSAGLGKRSDGLNNITIGIAFGRIY
jgi:hypothetical protein